MKKIIMFISMFTIATTVFACPDLSGKFSCVRVSGGDPFFSLKITQVGSGESTVYTQTHHGSTFTVKNSLSWMPIEDLDIDGIYKNYCKGQNLVYQADFKSKNGDEVEQVNITRLNVNGDIVITSQSLYNHGVQETVVTNCIRD